MSDQVAIARRAFAEELRFTAGLRSPAVIDAFATVPRERFLGPGPWRIKSPMRLIEYWTTDDADPRSVYHDVLIALDEARGINNGQPMLWAFLFDRLGIMTGQRVPHLGCGTGYYTAIMAHVAGPAGAIIAVELDAALAEKAGAALVPWPQVTVHNADGAHARLEPADVIVASAGATHPLASWLDALKPGGRLLFPMTSNEGPGGMLLVTHQNASAYAACFLSYAAFMEFTGARDAGISRRLASALARDRGAAVRSLRRDAHAEEESCWLHGEGWCLSCLDATAPQAAP